MRMIDADALKKEMLETYEHEYPTASGAFDEFASRIVPNIISNAPIIDAEPVRHGHWIYNKDTGEIRCNLCNALVGVTMYSDDVEPIAEVENFCFNCGAKMDEVSE